jgi:hypothetical protein
MFRLAAVVGLSLALGGCLYANQEALDNLASAPHCPFQAHVTYEGFEASSDDQGNPVEVSFGRFRFAEDTGSGGCLLLDAADLTPNASQTLVQILRSTTKYVDGGVYISYVPEEADVQNGYNSVQLITVYDNGMIELRGSCNSADGASDLVIPGVSVDSEGDSCHFDTEREIRNAAAGFRMISVSQTFRPARL